MLGVGVVAAHRVLVDVGVAVRVGVVDVEVLAVGRERDAEKALLVAAAEVVAQIERGARRVPVRRCGAAFRPARRRTWSRPSRSRPCRNAIATGLDNPADDWFAAEAHSREVGARSCVVGRVLGVRGAVRSSRWSVRPMVGAVEGAAALGELLLHAAPSSERRRDHGYDERACALEPRLRTPGRCAVRSVAVKYVVFVPDGCADVPLDELDGRTPLEAGAHAAPRRSSPRAVEVGRADVIPAGLPPGSDVGNMAILGFDPARYHTGRGADRGRGDGRRARARRGRVPLQPRDASPTTTRR